MADLDAAADFQRALAVRRRIAGDNVAEVCDNASADIRQITAKVNAAQMKAFLVRTTDKLVRFGNRTVSENCDIVPADRTDIARLAT